VKLQGKRILFVIADEFEDLEYHVPRMRLLEEGAEVLTAGLKRGSYRGKCGTSAEATLETSELANLKFDGAVVPGGWAPDKMRRDPKILECIQTLHEQNKIIGLICHAGWVAASAGILEPGLPVTGSLGIKDDLEARGSQWWNKAAFRNKNLVWGRVVADIPDFCRELVLALEEK
jgi:protease I